MEELIERGNIESLSLYIKHNLSWKQFRNGSGDSFLHLCVKYAKKEILDFLLSLGHPIDTQNLEGDTALHLACCEGNLVMVNSLLQQNANANIPNSNGDFPVHKAVESNNLALVQEIFRRNVSVTQKNSLGESPLHVAIDLNRSEIAEFLISIASDLDISDFSGNRPVHLVCRSNNLYLLRKIVEKNSKIEVLNAKNESPLTVCIKHSSTECLYYLIEAGVIIREEDVRIAREVSKPSIWQHISAIFKEQNHFSPKINEETLTTTEKPPSFEGIIKSLQAEKEKCEKIIKNLTKSLYIEDVSEIKIKESIGRGEFGEVFKAEWRFCEVAVKKYFNPQDLHDEFEILRTIRHPNIITLMAISDFPPMLITEFMENGSLSSILHDPSLVFTNKQLLSMAIDVAQGLIFLHTANPSVVHRDLKSANCLVDKNFRVKICDFGLAKAKNSTLKDDAAYGTFPYMAPEVISEQRYSVKSDVYAFGVLLWEILARNRPFEGLVPVQIIYQVVHNGKRPHVHSQMQFVDLIQQCWNNDPANRPFMSDVLKELKQHHEKM